MILAIFANILKAAVRFMRHLAIKCNEITIIFEPCKYDNFVNGPNKVLGFLYRNMLNLYK